MIIFFFKQKTAYEMRISDWSSDVCSSDLHNAVVVSQKTLAALMKCSRRTVQRAVDVLAEDRWIEIRQIGENGTVNAHIINDRVAWSGKRDGLRYSLFSAAVIISEAEQPDFEELGQQAPLRRLPSL